MDLNISDAAKKHLSQYQGKSMRLFIIGIG